jgi:hypothetical protein
MRSISKNPAEIHFTVAIYGPMVYTAPNVMLLIQANSLRA